MSADFDRADQHSSVIVTWLTPSKVGICIAGYVLFYVAFSYVVPRVHGKMEFAGQYGDMFGVVNAFASGLAMMGVALAVWLQRDQVVMQADELRAAKQEAKLQTAALQSQLQTAQSQMKMEGKAYIERNKPVVFSDRVMRPDGVGFDYMVRNVGGGFAINVYFIPEDMPVTETGDLPVRALGSLAPNAQMPFPDTLRKAMADSENHPVPHILLAEGPYSRTTQWTATLNYRSALYDPREGHVQHQVAATKVPPPRFKRQSLRRFLQNNLADIQQQLHALATNPVD